MYHQHLYHSVYGTVDIRDVVSAEFKSANSKVAILRTKIDENFLPNFENLTENYEIIHSLIEEKKVKSVMTVRDGGLVETITKMAIGNKIGFEFEKEIDVLNQMYGTFVVELEGEEVYSKLEVIGKTTEKAEIKIKDTMLDIDELIKAWEEPLEKVFPTKVSSEHKVCENILSDKTCNLVSRVKYAKPRIFIPAFPGTNCEEDMAKAFVDAGGNPHIEVFRNLKSSDIEESIEMFAKHIEEAQIIAIPGGFSAGDEPDGSGKFIASVFRNPKLTELIHKHLYEKDGLIIGICNGFQALVKLGLLPYGKITQMTEVMPTLTFNEIGRHQSKITRTKVISKLSPWFNKVALGEEFVIPISHGEGRFVAPKNVLQELIENGQIATQYVDLEGNATYDISYNPNGSSLAIEGITSKDGRILGKMGHSERCYTGVTKNIVGNPDQKLFESGVEYYS